MMYAHVCMIFMCAYVCVCMINVWLSKPRLLLTFFGWQSYRLTRNKSMVPYCGCA